MLGNTRARSVSFCFASSLALAIACNTSPPAPCADTQLATAKPPVVAAPVVPPAPVVPDDPNLVRIRDPQFQPAKVSAASEEQLKAPEKYKFTKDWFSRNIGLWTELSKDYVGKENVRYLEIGVFEGRSFLWMLDNVLTHESARAVGLEPFVSDTLRANLKASDAQERMQLIEEYSGIDLRKQPIDSYDIIYVDGSHTADNALEDIVLSWRLLKPGGILIIDDYLWEGNTNGRKRPADLRPQIAIDGFLESYRSFVEVLHKEYQVVVRRRAGACEIQHKLLCVSLGPYDYNWWDRNLKKGKAPVKITPAEATLIERVLDGKGDGVTITLSKELADSPELATLFLRLELPLQRVPASR